MQHTEAEALLTLHKHGRFIEMIILYYRTNNGTKIGKTIYLSQCIIAIIALTSRHLDPILHTTALVAVPVCFIIFHMPDALHLLITTLIAFRHIYLLVNH
jgi:hypothetical protein